MAPRRTKARNGGPSGAQWIRWASRVLRGHPPPPLLPRPGAEPTPTTSSPAVAAAAPWRYDPPRWFDRGEVHVTACRNEPTRWNLGLDRSSRTLEGTGEYVVLGGETELAGPQARDPWAT